MHDQTRWTYFFCEFMEMAFYYPQPGNYTPERDKIGWQETIVQVHI